MKTTPAFINANFKIRFIEPPNNPDPFTLKVPSSVADSAYVDIDFANETGQVHLANVLIPDAVVTWLEKSDGNLYSTQYPPVFSATHMHISTELERVARSTIEFVKYFIGRDELADDPISPIKQFNVSIDGNTFKKIPKLLHGYVKFKQQIALTPKVVEDLQRGIDNGIPPFLAMRHLYRAIQETNPRFKWIDATIAAELAVKEAIIRKYPLFEELLVEMPSPPLHKLYGSILHKYFGAKSPHVSTIADGVQKRNHLVHRPKETVITKKDAEDYVNQVMQAIHHLYTLLYPDWPMAAKLYGLKQFWQGDPQSMGM